jgi:mitochondrial fission protein ELM1
MVKNLNDKVVVVFTDRTPNMVKDKMNSRLSDMIADKSVVTWDSTAESSTLDKINTYENIIYNTDRVVLTADLDYACAHAASKRYFNTLVL